MSADEDVDRCVYMCAIFLRVERGVASECGEAVLRMCPRGSVVQHACVCVCVCVCLCGLCSKLAFVLVGARDSLLTYDGLTHLAPQ